jgi:hypothetical protein
MSSTSGHGRHRRLVLRSGGLFEGPRVLDVEGLFRNLRDLCLRSSGNTFPWCINIPHPGGQPTDIVASSHGSRIKWHIRRTTRDRYWGLCHNVRDPACDPLVILSSSLADHSQERSVGVMRKRYPVSGSGACLYTLFLIFSELKTYFAISQIFGPSLPTL